MGKMVVKLFLLLLVCLLAVGTATSFAEDQGVERGKKLFATYCAFCHGVKGDGKGQAGHVIYPKPRDFTSGQFRVRSTPTGEPPTDADLLDALKYGMPGSSMPSFKELQEGDLNSLVAYVKVLAQIEEAPSRIITPGTQPTVATPELLALGKKVYDKVQCWKCHGRDGSGNGPNAYKLKNDTGEIAFPNPFKKNIYKGGGSPSDIYLRFTTGMDGSPMPSYEDSLTDEERWAVVFYNYTLAGIDGVKVPYPDSFDRKVNVPTFILR